jgi:hypothetical protein
MAPANAVKATLGPEGRNAVLDKSFGAPTVAKARSPRRSSSRTARNQGLTALLDGPGADAHSALLTRASDPLLSHIGDRLRLKARERAALDSEPDLMSVPAFRAFETRYERPCANVQELAEMLAEACAASCKAGQGAREPTNEIC